MIFRRAIMKLILKFHLKSDESMVKKKKKKIYDLEMNYRTVTGYKEQVE